MKSNYLEDIEHIKPMNELLTKYEGREFNCIIVEGCRNLESNRFITRLLLIVQTDLLRAEGIPEGELEEIDKTAYIIETDSVSFEGLEEVDKNDDERNLLTYCEGDRIKILKTYSSVYLRKSRDEIIADNVILGKDTVGN